MDARSARPTVMAMSRRSSIEPPDATSGHAAVRVVDLAELRMFPDREVARPHGMEMSGRALGWSTIAERCGTGCRPLWRNPMSNRSGGNNLARLTIAMIIAIGMITNKTSNPIWNRLVYRAGTIGAKPQLTTGKPAGPRQRPPQAAMRAKIVLRPPRFPPRWAGTVVAVRLSWRRPPSRRSCPPGR